VTSSRHRLELSASGRKPTKKRLGANSHWMKDFAAKSQSRKADENPVARFPASQPNCFAEFLEQFAVRIERSFLSPSLQFLADIQHSNANLRRILV
jgi:hypothetical protein